MAKSKVRIEGEQTVSTAAEKASRSVRQLKEEIQKNLGPLKQLRDTFNAAFMATGALAAVKSIVSEVTKLTNAYKEHERAIYGVKLAAQDTAAGALTRMDEAMAKLNVERGRAIATFFRGLIDWYAKVTENAAKAAKTHNDYVDALDRRAKGQAAPEDPAAFINERISQLQKASAGLRSLSKLGMPGETSADFEQRQRAYQEEIDNNTALEMQLRKQAGIKAAAATAAADQARLANEMLKRLAESYAKTDEAKLKALRTEIAYWEAAKTKFKEHAAEIRAILLPLYDELAKKTPKILSSIVPNAPPVGPQQRPQSMGGMMASGFEYNPQLVLDAAEALRIQDAKKKITVLPNEAEAFDSITYAATRAAEEWDKWTEKCDKVNSVIAATARILGQVDAIASQLARNREIELENEYKTRLDAINSSISNEKKRATAIEALDKEFAPKRAALQTRGAKAAKASAIMGATMNTAEAVIAALASVKPTVPLGVAASIAAGVIGAAQIAVIAGQPIPKFARGGSFVVPPGYPNDSYRMAVESGEKVTVTPAAAVDAGGGEPLHVTVMLDSKVILDMITRASRERRVLIHAGAVV